MALVTLDQAKSHLRVDGDDNDTLITSKVNQASAIVRDYLKVDEDEWETSPSEDIPLVIEAATLLVVEALFDGTEPLSDTVKSLIHRFRDPALA